MSPEERAKLDAEREKRAQEQAKIQTEQAKIRVAQDRKLFPEQFINQEAILDICNKNKKRMIENVADVTSDSKKRKTDSVDDNSIVYFTIVGRNHSFVSTTKGQPVKLEREPNNFAIRVDNARGEKLGFVKKDIARKLSPIIDKLKTDVWAEVTGTIESHMTSAVIDFCNLDKSPAIRPKLDFSGVTDDVIVAKPPARRITTSPVFKVANPYAKKAATQVSEPIKKDSEPVDSKSE